ncbi:hypothetical protein HYY72_03215 [Candidatus Woesearchaeota archaeon]|nr:hypothetical protein [Candidatus Woesearchaeota archaeon]
MPLSLIDWARIIVVSSLGFFMMELGKFAIISLEKPGNTAKASHENINKLFFIS